MSRARRRGYSPLATGGTVQMDFAKSSGHSAVECELKNKKFWINKVTHRFRKSTLPGLAFSILRLNPILLSWLPLLIVLVWVGLFLGLSLGGIIMLVLIDQTVPAIIFGAVTFTAGFVLNSGLNRRGNNIKNMKSLISAAVNTMSGLEANMQYSAWLNDPKVTLEYANGAEYVQKKVGVMRTLEEISELLSAILAAQRNVQRGGFDSTLLPLDPWVLEEIHTRQKAVPQSDPLVTMQTMIWYRANKIAEAGGLMAVGEPIWKLFNKDLVDSLGNTAIDASAGVPTIFTVFYYFFLTLWIVYMPFWLIPLYPGFFVLLAAPLTIVFFTATVELGKRMPDIFVDSDDNIYSGYNLVQEIRVGAANIDQIYESIFAKVRDIKKSRAPAAGMTKTPVKPPASSTATPAPMPTPVAPQAPQSQADDGQQGAAQGEAQASASSFPWTRGAFGEGR